jgi:glycosyltransferase 2 family protein
VHDGESLLRHKPTGVLVGSFGYMGFDIATLGVCFLAFGYTPGLGVLVVGYIIGQLGGLLPIPGGIGGTEGGLIGTFALYHVPLSASATAVLTYRAFQLWLPAVLGSIAFLQLRRSLHEHNNPAAMCQPLAEPIPALPSLRG